MEVYCINIVNIEYIKVVGLVVVKNVRINVGIVYDSCIVNMVVRILCIVFSYFCICNRIIRFVVWYLSYCVDGCIYR